MTKQIGDVPTKHGYHHSPSHPKARIMFGNQPQFVDIPAKQKESVQTWGVRSYLHTPRAWGLWYTGPYYSKLIKHGMRTVHRDGSLHLSLHPGRTRNAGDRFWGWNKCRISLRCGPWMVIHLHQAAKRIIFSKETMRLGSTRIHWLVGGWSRHPQNTSYISYSTNYPKYREKQRNV